MIDFEGEWRHNTLKDTRGRGGGSHIRFALGGLGIGFLSVRNCVSVNALAILR